MVEAVDETDVVRVVLVDLGELSMLDALSRPWSPFTFTFNPANPTPPPTPLPLVTLPLLLPLPPPIWPCMMATRWGGRGGGTWLVFRRSAAAATAAANAFMSPGWRSRGLRGESSSPVAAEVGGSKVAVDSAAGWCCKWKVGM